MPSRAILARRFLATCTLAPCSRACLRNPFGHGAGDGHRLQRRRPGRHGHRSAGRQHAVRLRHAREQIAVTNADSSTTSYTYDGEGHILSLTDADANATTWVYQLNQPVQETTPLGTSYSTYDQLGDLVSQTDADGRVTTYSYNSLGEKTAENWLDGEGNPIYTFTYGCDTLGDLTTESDPAASYAYDYNSLGEATSITQSIAGLTPSVTLTQQFDAAGDRTSVSDNLGGTTTYGYNLVGQMTSVGMTVTGLTASPQVTLGYGNGQSLTSISRYDAGAGGAAYVNTAIGYDTLGRVTSISDTAGSTPWPATT